MLWLYLRFPNLYLQHVLLDKQIQTTQTDNHQAVAIVCNQQRILCCNTQAQAQGVSQDMALSTAFCLAPNLIAMPFAAQQQEQQLLQQGGWAQNYSATISLDPPDGLWLEVGSMQRLFNGLSSLNEKIKTDLDEQGWLFESAIAPTPFAAKALADTTGAIIENTQQLQPLLHNLTIDALQLPDKIKHGLQRMGIRNHQQLLALPAREIGYRFGAEVSQYLEQLSGQRAHVLPLFEAPETFHQVRHFLEEIEHQKGILFPLKRLLTELCRFLNRRHLSSQILQLELQHRYIEPTQWRIVLAAASHTLEDFLFVCRNFIERQQLAAPVLQISLTVDNLHEIKMDQGASGDLLAPLAHLENNAAFHIEEPSADYSTEPSADYSTEPSAGYSTEHVKKTSGNFLKGQQLLNRLHARLQPNCVQGIRLTPDPRPEYQTFYQSSTELAVFHNERTKQQQNAKHNSLPYPLWLYPAPIAIKNQEHYQLLAGPERFNSGWWDGHSIQRDYYLAKHKYNHQQLWIFQQHDGWFIHGVYA